MFDAYEGDGARQMVSLRAWPDARGDDPFVAYARFHASLGPHDAAVPQRAFNALFDQEGLHPVAVDVHLDVSVAGRDPAR